MKLNYIFLMVFDKLQFFKQFCWKIKQQDIWNQKSDFLNVCTLYSVSDLKAREKSYLYSTWSIFYFPIKIQFAQRRKYLTNTLPEDWFGV